MLHSCFKLNPATTTQPTNQHHYHHQQRFRPQALTLDMQDAWSTTMVRANGFAGCFQCRELKCNYGVHHTFARTDTLKRTVAQEKSDIRRLHTLRNTPRMKGMARTSAPHLPACFPLPLFLHAHIPLAGGRGAQAVWVGRTSKRQLHVACARL